VLQNKTCNSDRLLREFTFSFRANVDPDVPRDTRATTLHDLLGLPVEQVVELMEPWDLAAAMSCCVCVKGDVVQRCLAAYTYKSPIDIETLQSALEVDPKAVKTAAFIAVMAAIPEGADKLLKIVVCLARGCEIPGINNYLWTPKESI